MKRLKTAPETVGERLAKAREKLGLSVEDVAKRTKMHSRIVVALEDDQPVERLSPVYVRSFLRMYARLVGVNEQTLLHDFAQQHPSSPAPAVAAPSAPVRRAAPAPIPAPAPLSSRWSAAVWRPTRAQWLVAGGIAVAILGAWALVAVWRHHPVRRSPPPTRAAKTAASPFRLSRRKPAPAQPPITASTASAFPTMAIPAQEPLKLQVTAKERVWLRVTADGRTIFQNVLEKGRSEQWTANERLDLWLGSAGSVDLVLNHRALGSPGRRGDVIRDLIVTHRGMQVQR